MRRLPVPLRGSLSALLLGALSLCVPAHAQTDPDRVYRCPDNSYTNMLSVVHEKHCKPVDNANISIVAPGVPAARCETERNDDASETCGRECDGCRV